jgi:hypothetical protein
LNLLGDEKEGPPESGPGTSLGLRLVAFGLGEDDAITDRQGVELDAQAGAIAVRPGGADPRPDGFLAFALFDAVAIRVVACFSCCVLS